MHDIASLPDGAFAAEAAVPAAVDPTTVERLSLEIGGVLDSAEELSDYLERVVHAVREHVPGCDEAGITVMSHNRPGTAAYTSVRILEPDSAQYELGEGPCLDSVARRVENRVGAAELRARFPRFAARAEPAGVCSLAALPLRSGEECVGALNLYAWHDDAFDETTLSLARVAASRAADAVVALTGLEGAKRLAGQLEEAMASRAVIEQAKGVLMAMRGLDEHAAFAVLRRTSQDRNVKVRVLAAEVIADVVGSRPGAHLREVQGRKDGP